MKAFLIALTLLFASLLLAGCGAQGEGSSSSGSAPETTTSGAAETTGTAAPDGSATLVIDASGGERVELSVETADDDAERQRGLMQRTKLAENAGMLFVFGRERTLSFWMKDTLIPLSIAYLDADGRIIDIQDMKPLDETGHPSAEPAQYALEVNQGFYEERGIRVGDTVELPAR